MQQLRDPKSGCEWDKKQNFQSLTIFTLEEAYEVADANRLRSYFLIFTFLQYFR